jgi:hypothetical protein
MKSATHQMNHEEAIDALQERLDAYRKRSLKLASELDAERKEKQQLELTVAQLKHELARHTGFANQVLGSSSPDSSGCNSCGATSQHQHFCVHKSALATHIIDLTFDGHKDMLRNKLRAATEELEKLRQGGGGSVADDLRREVATLEAVNSAQKKELDALRRDLCDAKINALKARSAAASKVSPTSIEVQPAYVDSSNDRRRQMEERAEQSLLLQQALRTMCQLELLGHTREEWLMFHSICVVSSVASMTHSTKQPGDAGGEACDDPLERHFGPLGIESSNSAAHLHRPQLHPPLQQLRTLADDGDASAMLTPRGGTAATQSNHALRKRTSTQPRPLRGLL